jgi:putative membrane-bound dehydrogenase-like protein
MMRLSATEPWCRALVQHASKLVHRIAILAGVFWIASSPAVAQSPSGVKTEIAPKRQLPHGQDRPPGPALSPAEAIARMKVPEGFHVELVAAEPDLVNPVAMTFDERGRIWVTESLEYPRHSAGPGRDRIKILEDTDGDGKVDKVTVFADGLNIPSGIAVGHGGVWVANSPDILFLQDTDGDGKADRREVVVTGFGRDDTHELPNSLSWGPDGYLYGLNGVFNQSHVRSGDRDFKFTCAMFRINPRTRRFELFCEGTSNPWGIAWDEQGSAFVSACVIDHLWHLTETGYYHRQGGPYPPFTWKIGSIANFKHQKAAYCGLHYFDSEAYPPQYRRRLYMGNIHGGCINVDTLSRDGSTYSSEPAPDFLTANDAWFMPVSQKTGPDGCLYILDWYDRYHCYQDAGRDPAGIDRLKGRLYRVRYRQTPHYGRFDFAKDSDDDLLVQLQIADNNYVRDTIVRLLSERHDRATRPKLQKMILKDLTGRTARMYALRALAGSLVAGGASPDGEFLAALMSDPEPALRAWAVRIAGNNDAEAAFAPANEREARRISPAVRRLVIAAAHDVSPDVRLQATIAAPKVVGIQAIPVLIETLSHSGDDPLIPHIVWNNLLPLMEDRAATIVSALGSSGFEHNPIFAEFVPRLFERLLSAKTIDRDALRETFHLAVYAQRPAATQRCLRILFERGQNRELSGSRLEVVKSTLAPGLHTVLSGPHQRPLYRDVTLLAASWRDPEGMRAARALAADARISERQRIAAVEALAAANDASILEPVETMLSARRSWSPGFRARLIGALARLDAPGVAELVLAHYDRLDPDEKPVAIQLLTQRVAWSKSLLAAIGAGHVPAHDLNLSQVRKLLAFGDKELIDEVHTRWGRIRDSRDPQREQVIARMRKLIRDNHGDAAAGEQVFQRICGQCHKIHGKGNDVGPEITLNGRSSFDQLLSNVFDPNLVIGAAYRAVVVVTKEGRVLTGLLAEDNPRRIVLKVQGGKVETVPRDDVETVRISNISLMPEQIENQMKPQEIVDLFTFLSYDKHPSDPTARQLPGLHVEH